MIIAGFCKKNCWQSTSLFLAITRMRKGERVLATYTGKWSFTAEHYESTEVEIIFPEIQKKIKSWNFCKIEMSINYETTAKEIIYESQKFNFYYC